MAGTKPFPRSSGLLVLRHAQSTWNAAGRWQGWADPPLSAVGEEQVAVVAEILRTGGAGPFDAAYSSDLQRARRTAELLCAALQGPEPIPRTDLREHDVGAWSGLTRDEIELRWPGQIALWSRGELASTPGGERRPAFEARIHAAVLDIAQHHLGQRVLVVCHGGAIRALTRVISTEQTHVGSLSGCWISLEHDRLQLGEPFDPEAYGADLPVRSTEAPSP